MSGGIAVRGGVANRLAEVDANLQLQVAMNVDPAKSGSIRFFSENDPGAVTGTAELLSPETSQDYRLRVGLDTPVFLDVLNATAQDTGKYRYDTSTLTTTFPGGGILLNGAANTAAGSTAYSTRHQFPMAGGAELYAECTLALNAVPPSNFTLDIGLGLIPTSAPFAPTDGVYFRITSAGIYGYMNNGGESGTTTFMAAGDIGINKNRRLVLTISAKHVEFWVDDVMIGERDIPDGVQGPFLSNALPWFARLTQPGTAGAICQAKIGAIAISLGDYAYSMTSSHIMARMGSHAYQGQGGSAMGSTAQWAVSADPAAALILSPVTPQALGLGGQARFLGPATGTTEGVIFSYLNTITTTAVQGKTLLVSGVNLSCVNLVNSVNTTATVLAWSVAFGHTSISLATAEAATTKAPRRKGLGFMTWPIGALVGTMPTNGDVERAWDVPIAVNPGEYFQIVCKCPLGTATATQAIWVIADVDAQFM
jgi:hypothetical protein